MRAIFKLIIYWTIKTITVTSKLALTNQYLIKLEPVLNCLRIIILVLLLEIKVYQWVTRRVALSNDISAKLDSFKVR